MTKSQYPFPPDEFDARRPEGSPVGVHREPRSRWSTVWPFLLVAVVFAGVAYGVVSYLSDDRVSDTPPVASSTQEAAGGEDGGGEDVSGGEAGAEGEASGEPTDEASEEPAEELSEEDVAALLAQADVTAPVFVENAAGIPGLAGETAAVLTDAGFSNVATANFVGDAPAESTVRYVGDRAETSAAVAAVLGIPQSNVEQVDSLPNGEVAAIMLGPAG